MDAGRQQNFYMLHGRENGCGLWLTAFLGLSEHYRFSVFRFRDNLIRFAKIDLRGTFKFLSSQSPNVALMLCWGSGKLNCYILHYY